MIKINSSLNIKNTVIKNRIVVPPMASQTALGDGKASVSTIAHYRRLASSGAGLVMVEYSFVHKNGKSEDNQLGADSDDQISGLSRIASIIRESGGVPALQLVHAGAKSSTDLTGGPLISPSNISVPVKGERLETPRAANSKQIKEFRDSFVSSVGRARKSGFNIIEIHAAHGYGLNQWLSPLTNKRCDLYGGSVLKRARLLFEIITEIKERFPDIILSVRLPGQDHMAGGLTQEDSLLICRELEIIAGGIDIINISSGIGGWRRPRNVEGEGYLVSDAGFIQRSIKIPVIGVGGIKTKEYINSQLALNSFSLAAIGRGILENPKLGHELGIK
jgi:NADPH2 dehydrogenase